MHAVLDALAGAATMACQGASLAIAHKHAHSGFRLVGHSPLPTTMFPHATSPQSCARIKLYIAMYVSLSRSQTARVSPHIFPNTCSSHSGTSPLLGLLLHFVHAAIPTGRSRTALDLFSTCCFVVRPTADLEQSFASTQSWRWLARYFWKTNACKHSHHMGKTNTSAMHTDLGTST